MKHIKCLVPLFAFALAICPVRGEGESKAVTGPIFENSLGQKFVEIGGSTVLFSIWETRNSDYQAFIRATGRKWSRSGFSQGGSYPAAKVNWEDASFFLCVVDC